MPLRPSRSVGLSPLTVGRPAPLEMVTAAEAGGFESIGVTLTVPGGRESPLCRDDRLRSEVLRRLTGAGVAVRDVGAVVLTPSLDLTRVARVIAVGHELGASLLVVINEDPDVSRAASSLRVAAELAGSADMQVGLEFMPYSRTRTLAEAKDLVGRADRPNARIVLDLLHLSRSGGSAEDLRTGDLSLVALVQLCDAAPVAPPADQLRAEALGGRLHPGEGGLPVREVLDRLPGDVPVTLEAPRVRDAGLCPQRRAVLAARALVRFLGPVDGG